jgi:hypothetical protein
MLKSLPILVKSITAIAAMAALLQNNSAAHTGGSK